MKHLKVKGNAYDIGYQHGTEAKKEVHYSLDSYERLFHYEKNIGWNETREIAKDHIDYLDRHDMSALHTNTQIMIAPGYTYHIVRCIVTNFHQPKSTLLLLVSAFVKGDWHKIYDYALSHDFRFLSYGDSSLLIP